MIKSDISIIEKFGVKVSRHDKKNGYMGVSICSHNFSKRNISKIIEWASYEFKEFLILIADEPQAYTFMASKNLPYNDALEKAKLIGEQKFRSIQNQVARLGHKNIKVIKWDQIETDSNFQLVFNKLKLCFENDNKFKLDVYKQVYSRNNQLAENFEHSIIDTAQFNIASLYVLNEITAMFILQELWSYPIQVYPAKILPVLMGLYQNKYKIDLKLQKDKTGYLEIGIKN